MAIKIPPRKKVPQVWPAVTLINPGKGLNNLISDEYIKDEEASALQNIMFVEAGNPSKRPGHTAVGTGLVNNPKGLASFYTTSNRYLLTIDGTSLKYLNSTTWTAISGASFTTNSTTTFCQARGSIYIWNGVDAGRKLDSTLTLTAPTTTVSAAFGIYYNGRQIVAGTSTNPSRLYISNASAADDFTVATGGTVPQPDNATDAPGASTFAGTPGNTEANVLDISKDDGDRITALSKFNDLLIVFKERSVWSVTFDSTGVPTVKQISASMGCVSHRTVDNVENDVFFLSRNGFYTLGYQANFTNDLPRTNELSQRIHPIVETITPANLSKTAGLFSGYTYYCSLPTGGTTTNNKTVTYDKRYNAWSVWTNVNANAFTEFIDSSNVKHLYYAADDVAQVYEIDSSYSDNGVAIDSSWTSKAFNFGDFSLQKQILYIDFEFRVVSGTVGVAVYTDNNTLSKTRSVGSTNDTTGTWGDEMWGDPIWGGSNAATTTTITGSNTSNVPYRLFVNKTSRTVKVKIYNANNNESFTFLGMKIYYRPYPVQKFDSAYKLT